MSLRTPTAGEMRIHDAVAVKKVSDTIPKDLEPLAKEAKKKYK